MSANAGDALAAPAGRVRRAFDGAALRRWVRALLYELVHRPMTWVLAVLGLAGCAAETCGMLAMLGAGHEVPVLPLKVLHPFAAVDGVTTAYAYFVGCLAIAVTAGPYRQGAAALRGVWAQDRRVCLLASVTAVLMASLVWTVAAAVVCWAVSLLPVVHAAGGPVISPAAAWARTAGPTLLLALMAVGIGWLTRATGRGVALWYAVMVLMHSVCLLLVGFGVAGVAVGALDPFLAVQRMGLAGAPVAVEVFPFPQWQYWVIAAGWLVVLAIAGGRRALRGDL